MDAWSKRNKNRMVVLAVCIAYLMAFVPCGVFVCGMFKVRFVLTSSIEGDVKTHVNRSPNFLASGGHPAKLSLRANWASFWCYGAVGRGGWADGSWQLVVGTGALLTPQPSNTEAVLFSRKNWEPVFYPGLFGPPFRLVLWGGIAWTRVLEAMLREQDVS
jgi:hypothetical protein